MSGGRRDCAILTLAFLLTLPALTARFYASDEIQYFSWLRSVVFDRDADFENEYRHFYEAGAQRMGPFRATFLELTNEAGRRPNFGTIGSALLWSPFYALGHVAALVTGAPLDGYSQPYITAVAIASACYAFLALVLSVAIARRVVGAGLGAGLIVWVGTPLLFYMYIAPGFAHACSAFTIALLIWTWLRVREHWTAGGAAQLGLVAALAPMVREQDLFFLAGPAIDFLRWAWRRRAGEGSAGLRGALVAGGVGAATCVVAYLPQLFAYQALNGHFGPTRLVTRKMSWTSPHALEVLFSPAHGFFFWTPLAVVAVGGLIWLALGRARATSLDARWIGALALVMIALEVYVSGAVESWTVAGSFGQRRFVAATPLLVLGLAAIVASTPSPADGRTQSRAGLRAIGVVVFLCVWWNLALMAQFGRHTMDRQRLTLAENARAAFIDLPREMPTLAWQYLTDRASFYGRPRQ
jgi:hypothetical protein